MGDSNHLRRRTPGRVSWWCGALCLCLVNLLGPAYASSAESILVEQLNGSYHVRMQFEVNAPPERVREILTDYDHLNAINPKIVASHVLEHPAANVTRISYEIRHCIWVYCLYFVIVEDITALEDGGFSAKVIPERSDFENGHTVWSLATSPQGTLIGFESSLEPRFWVIPILGPIMIKNTLREQVAVSADRIQNLAKAKNR